MGEASASIDSGDDEALMPLISGPMSVRMFPRRRPYPHAKTCAAGKHNHVKVGAHPSLSDLRRRPARAENARDELTNCISYHVGSAQGVFLEAEGVALTHMQTSRFALRMAALGAKKCPCCLAIPASFQNQPHQG